MKGWLLTMNVFHLILWKSSTYSIRSQIDTSSLLSTFYHHLAYLNYTMNINKNTTISQQQQHSMNFRWENTVASVWGFSDISNCCKHKIKLYHHKHFLRTSLFGPIMPLKFMKCHKYKCVCASWCANDMMWAMTVVAFASDTQRSMLNVYITRHYNNGKFRLLNKCVLMLHCECIYMLRTEKYAFFYDVLNESTTPCHWIA